MDLTKILAYVGGTVGVLAICATIITVCLRCTH